MRWPRRSREGPLACHRPVAPEPFRSGPVGRELDSHQRRWRPAQEDSQDDDGRSAQSFSPPRILRRANAGSRSLTIAPARDESIGSADASANPARPAVNEEFNVGHVAAVVRCQKEHRAFGLCIAPGSSAVNRCSPRPCRRPWRTRLPARRADWNAMSYRIGTVHLFPLVGTV